MNEGSTSKLTVILGSCQTTYMTIDRLLEFSADNNSQMKWQTRSIMCDLRSN